MTLAIHDSDALARIYAARDDEQHQHIGLTLRTWMKRSSLLRSAWIVNRTNRFTGNRHGVPVVCVVDDFGNLREIDNLPRATMEDGLT